MVRLYDRDGGKLLATLQPSACTVSETAGGSYEVSATLPCNDARWQMAQPDTIIEVDTPATYREGFMRGPTSWYKVTGSRCYLYTELVNKITNFRNIFDPEAGITYSAGDPLAYYVDDMDQSHWRNDDCVYSIRGHTGGGSEGAPLTPGPISQWEGIVAAACGQITEVYSAPLYENEISRYYIRSNFEYGFVWQPGNTLPALLPPGTTMTKISDFDQMFIQVALTDGRVGYVSRRQVEYFSTRARQVRDDGEFVDIPTGEWENGYIDMHGVNTLDGSTRHLRTVDYIPVNSHTRLQFYTQANLAFYVRDYASDYSYLGVRGHADLDTARTDTISFHPGTAYIRITMRVPSKQTISTPEDADWYAAYELTDADWDYPPETITRQRFRLDSVTVNGTAYTAQLHGVHISYDHSNDMLGACEIQMASPASAVDLMREAELETSGAIIATNCTGVIRDTGWSYRSIVGALLDPDGGLVPLTGARLIRTDHCFYVLADEGRDAGATVRYGTNLTGVSWTEDCSEVVTRVYPLAQDANGQTIYLPEGHIDSPLAVSYGAIRAEILDTGLQVGMEQRQADGSVKTLTLADVQEQMRELAQARFNVDHADEARLELTVGFILLGDTQEYAQYRGLQRLQLYDYVRVFHERLGLSARAQMTAYTWDALARRYTAITLSNARRFGIRRTAGYEMGDKSVSLRTLTPELRARLGI